MNTLRITVIALAVVVLATSADAYEGFHGKSKMVKPNYDSLFQAATRLEESPEGRAVMDSCRAAYGGVEHLRRMESVRMTWRMKALMSSDSLDVVKTMSRNRHHKIEKTAGDRIERRIISGKRCWYETADTLIELDDGRYKALVLMLTRTRPVADRAYRARTAYVWPRVSRGDNDRAAWAETVSAGLLTAKEAAQMRRMGSGYMGWRTGIDVRGRWLFDIAGD